MTRLGFRAVNRIEFERLKTVVLGHLRTKFRMSATSIAVAIGYVDCSGKNEKARPDSVALQVIESLLDEGSIVEEPRSKWRPEAHYTLAGTGSIPAPVTQKITASNKTTNCGLDTRGKLKAAIETLKATGEPFTLQQVCETAKVGKTQIYLHQNEDIKAEAKRVIAELRQKAKTCKRSAA